VATVVQRTVGDEYRDAVRPAMETVRRWAELHGYTYDADHLPAFPERPAPWAKLPLLLERLADETLWVDADCVASCRKPLEAFLPSADSDVVFARDPVTRISTGVMYLRPTARALLLAADKDPQWRRRELWDQDAIDAALDQTGLRWTVAPKLAGNLWHREFRRCGRVRTDRYFDGTQLFCHVSGVRSNGRPNLPELARIIRQKAAVLQ